MNAITPLAGKIALVTGGARGIGLETSRALAKLGATVVIGARQISRAESVAAALRTEHLAAEGIELDVVNDANRKGAYALLARRFGVPDILINNAAVWLESANAASLTSPVFVGHSRASLIQRRPPTRTRPSPTTPRRPP
jgi:NAD(P)-dependent dehydrogenase (short-subunit alcohol dehydrogenase family)